MSLFRLSERQDEVVERPVDFNAFEFAVLAGLRAKQLAQGCTPRVGSADKVAITAQLEVAAGRIVRAPAAGVDRAVARAFLGEAV